jgi:hypothetical protein
LNILKSIKPSSITVYTILKNIERSVIYKNNKNKFYDEIGSIYNNVLSKT